jgi:N-dimethylarginine dimethylaminohydrolase
MLHSIKKPIFLMSPPFKFNAEVPNNYWMQQLSKDKRKVDQSKAIDQWHRLYNELSKSAIIYLLPTAGMDGKLKPLQDQVFVANIGCVLPHDWNTIFVANFRSPPRRGETEPALNFFKNLAHHKEIIVPRGKNIFFEGEADLKPIYGSKNVFMGAYGQRTSLPTLKWFQDNHNIKIIPIKTNPKAYHLDCIVFPIDKEKVVVIEHMISPKILQKIGKYADIIPITDKEVSEVGITNCIRSGKTVICGVAMDDMSPKHEQYKNEKKKADILEKITSKLGLNLVLLPLSEFRIGGGDCSCLVMRLNPGLEFHE